MNYYSDVEGEFARCEQDPITTLPSKQAQARILDTRLYPGESEKV